MSFTQSVIDVATRAARREVAAAGVARAGWGTVTGVSPLAVTLDESSSGAMGVTPVSLVDGLTEGDRVWVEHSIRRAVIIGRYGTPDPDTGWLACTYASGFSEGTRNRLEARQVGSTVYLRGVVAGAFTGGTDANAVATLPTVITPPTQVERWGIYRLGVTESAVGYASTNRTIYVNAPTTETWVAFSNSYLI